MARSAAAALSRRASCALHVRNRFFFNSSSCEGERFVVGLLRTKRVSLLLRAMLILRSSPALGIEPLKLQVVCPQNGTDCGSVVGVKANSGSWFVLDPTESSVFIVLRFLAPSSIFLIFACSLRPSYRVSVFSSLAAADKNE